ncbi:hypothetical protein C8R45DRAFT_935113 [Mycena sanguinolenta]|nr:hypothetical protein C8R45DRAFT_935113 [Mycena sanguinolenta]
MKKEHEKEEERHHGFDTAGFVPGSRVRIGVRGAAQVITSSTAQRTHVASGKLRARSTQLGCFIIRIRVAICAPTCASTFHYFFPLLTVSTKPYTPFVPTVAIMATRKTNGSQPAPSIKKALITPIKKPRPSRSKKAVGIGVGEEE